MIYRGTRTATLTFGILSLMNLRNQGAFGAEHPPCLIMCIVKQIFVSFCFDYLCSGKNQISTKMSEMVTESHVSLHRVNRIIWIFKGSTPTNQKTRKSNMFLYTGFTESYVSLWSQHQKTPNAYISNMFRYTGFTESFEPLRVQNNKLQHVVHLDGRSVRL